jgi:hypothetical protein
MKGLSMAGKRVVVTDWAGFLGSFVVEWLWRTDWCGEVLIPSESVGLSVSSGFVRRRPLRKACVAPSNDANSMSAFQLPTLNFRHRHPAALAGRGRQRVLNSLS